MLLSRDVNFLSQREEDVFRLSLDEKKSVSITRLLLLPSREPYLPPRGSWELDRHIPAIKINATSLIGPFFNKAFTCESQ